MSFVALGANSETWTLDSCINYAIDNNLSVKLSHVNTLSAEQSVVQAKSGYLPNVSASAGQSWNLGRGLTAENTYANRSTSSFNWGLSANIPVFDGLSTHRRTIYAKANLNEMVERYEAAKEDITINVISGYLQALYTAELLEVAHNQVKLSKYELERRVTLAEAGKIPEIDILEAKSQLASDELNEVQANNNHIMALIDLARLLRLDDIDDFDIAPLKEGTNTLITEPDEAFLLALRYNHGIKAANLNIDAAEASINLSKSGYLPTLSFNTSTGSTYYRVSGFNNDGFGTQMKNNYSTYFGFSLNVPIFDAFNTRNSVRDAKIRKLQAELQLEQAKDELHRTIDEAYYAALGAYKKYESSLVSESYALSAFDAVREKYQLGRATNTDYEQANTKALQATAERIQANYELVLRTRILQYYTNPH